MAHLDEIGVLECNFALYYFLDEGLLKLQLAEDLRSKYIVGRLLGQGASASVKEGFTRVGHKRRAIKIIDKEGEQYNDTEDLDLMREVDILRGIKHPCIAEVFEAVETMPHICHFFYTDRIFENQILHPKKRLKAPKTLKMSLKKSNICIFFTQSGKIYT